MDEPKFQRGDIVMSLPPFKTHVYVILDYNPRKPKNKYDAIRPETGDEYILSDESLIKIGEANEEFLDKKGRFDADNSHIEQHFESGRRRAEWEAKTRVGDEAHRWAILAKAKHGDRINAHTRDGLQSLKFHYVIEGGEKYVFLAENEDGKTYRYTLNCICLGQD